MYHLTDLGTLGGATTNAYSINSGGTIVGRSYTATDSNNGHGFLYQNGSMMDLGTPFGGDTFPSSINDSGKIVGTGFSTASVLHGFVYSNGAYTDLRPSGLSKANDINASNQVAGRSTNHALLYSGRIATDLGTLGGASSEANGINDSGQVVLSSRVVPT